MRRSRPRAVAALLAPLTLLLVAGVALAASPQYRLAGTVAVGPDHLGILELPGGEQLLVRKGSVVQGGRVVLLDATRLRLEFPGRVVELALDGSAAAAVVPPSLGVVQEQRDDGNVLIRRVDAQAFSDSVARSRATTAAPSAAGARGKGVDQAAEAGRRLAPILNLPPDSRIFAVNEQPVRSAEQAIRLIQRSLDAGISPRLNLADAGGKSRVYVSPAQP